jgi:hypothetical protein
MVSSEEKLAISIFAGLVLWFVYLITSVFHTLRYSIVEVGLFAGFYAILTRILME